MPLPSQYKQAQAQAQSEATPKKGKSIIDIQEENQDLDSIYQHFQQSSLSEISIKDQVFALIDQPNNSDNLIMVLSSIVQIEDDKELFSQPKLKEIDKILRKQLKDDRISISDYGIVHTYLNRLQCDKLTQEQAFFRVYENIKKMSLLDISLALINLDNLENEDNKKKILKKIESYVILTHENLMKGMNLKGLLYLIEGFEGYNFGSAECWRKLDKLLEQQLSLKRGTIEKDTLITNIQVLSNKMILNQSIWDQLLKDVSFYMEENLMTLKNCYKLAKAFYKINIQSAELFNEIIDYIVKKGYDNDDYKKDLGLSRGTKFIYYLFSSDTKIQNNNFLVHSEEFIQQNFNDFTCVQLQKFIDIYSKFETEQSKELVQRLVKQFKLLQSNQKKPKQSQGFKFFNENEDVGENSDSDFEEGDDDEEGFQFSNQQEK